MGILRVCGQIDIAQFWPIGSSDADTTKVRLIVHQGSFEFKREGATKFVKTTVFKDAVSRGQVSKQVIAISKKNREQTITVRLQGIDAPELHYRAAPLKKSVAITDTKRKSFNDLNHDRRQCFAETATRKLCDNLKKYASSKGLINAVFETLIDNPSDAIDTYGRFVGNIRIGKNHVLNFWLLENGWGHPAFYVSMAKLEIDAFLKAWEKGKKKLNTPAKFLSVNAGAFNWELLYRRPDKEKPIQFAIGSDKGDVLMPKLFRRQVSWLVSKKSKVITSTTNFQSYLRGKPDTFFLLKDYRRNPQKPGKILSLHDFISADNKALKNPEDFVFKEKPATLFYSSGKKIISWN